MRETCQCWTKEMSIFEIFFCYWTPMRSIVHQAVYGRRSIAALFSRILGMSVACDVIKTLLHLFLHNWADYIYSEHVETLEVLQWRHTDSTSLQVVVNLTLTNVSSGMMTSLVHQLKSSLVKSSIAWGIEMTARATISTSPWAQSER